MEQRLAFLHAMTSLHSGTGQGVGSIDLPIARERATNLPLVPGSSIKGCLRDSLRDSKVASEDLLAIFGPERGEDASKHSGALRVSDGRVLLLPVRCLGAHFVWVTCPFVLRRFSRDLEALGVKDAPAIPAVEESKALLASAEPLVTIGKQKKLVLEELDFDADETGADKWREWIGLRLWSKESSWQSEFKKRFAIVDDKSFDYLSEFATEVNAHVAINDETGTVEPGALWYQESLPAETVMYLLLQAEDARREGSKLKAAEVLNRIPETRNVQFGGKASTGMGVARFVPVGGAK